MTFFDLLNYCAWGLAGWMAGNHKTAAQREARIQGYLLDQLDVLKALAVFAKGIEGRVDRIDGLDDGK